MTTGENSPPRRLILKPGSSLDLFTASYTSERLRLVPPTAEFGDEIFKEFTTEITRYMTPKPCDERSELDTVLEIFAAERASARALVFAITLGTTGEFLGCCGIHSSNQPRIPDLGLWVKKSAHGHKYGREAIHALITFANEHLDVDGFTYSVDRRNIASVKIPQFLGGTVIEEKKITNMSGNELDEFVFFIPAR